jgi:DNA polymerase type B, organellar and viral
MDESATVEFTPDGSLSNDSDEFRPFLVAPCTIEVREQPGGPVAQYSVVRGNLEPIAKGLRRDAQPPKVVLAGFDTEYQSLKPLYTHNEVVKGKEARYEVLSYQLFIKHDDHTLREIIIPEPRKRINFVDFITYAVAKLTSVCTSVPRTWVLVGHFNKADFPAFDDRGETLRKLAAIRSSMVTLGYPIKIRMMFSEVEEDFEELYIHVRDSILMAPAGQRSLAAVGDLMGIEKIKLHDDPEVELDMKQNMASVRENLWERFRQYALLDAEISALYFERMMELYQRVSGTNRIPTSLSNIGPQLLVKEWNARKPKIDRLKILGKEAFKEEIWNDATASYYTQRSELYQEHLFWHIDFVTSCFHGGRAEQMWFGPSDADEFADYDLAAAYPTAMAMLAEPMWDSIRPTTDLADLRLGKFSFACVDFEFPDDVRYPVLPVRTENGLIHPLKGRSYCCSPEIEVALELGASIKICHAVTIDTTDELPFFHFIKRTIRLRHDATEPIEQALWKEVTNSCYGKTAQGLRRKRTFNLKTLSNKPVPESSITNPFFAAYITSLVRAVIGELINAIPRDKSVFSVTTDGFLTNASSEEIRWAATGDVARIFSQTRQRLAGNPEILTEKHAVKRLLGMRTRGQATLEEGSGAHSKGIVLAKAGIKTPSHTTTVAEQNDYIVESFINRLPGRRFLIDTQTTLREIMLFNADLVMKRTERSISMEYDFKRCPERAWDSELAFKGKNYQHLAFTTKPWTTVEEFKETRGMWKTFSYSRKVTKDEKGKRKTVRFQTRCLKTTADFRAFAYFHDTRVAVKEKSRAYLKSDLSRLRLNLCRAYQQGKAGLHELKSKLNAREFAALLNDCGFSGDNEVTTHHVEYGLRKPFEYHATPPTELVLGVLQRLELRVPSLRAGDILPQLEGLIMLMRALETQ